MVVLNDKSQYSKDLSLFLLKFLSKIIVVMRSICYHLLL